LGKIESELGKRKREARAAGAKLSSLTEELAATKAEAKALEHALAERQMVLRQRIVALYRWQRGGSPMVILNGTPSLAAMMQRRHYLQAALNHDRALAAELNDASQRQAALRQEMEQRIAKLDEQKHDLDAAKEAAHHEARKKKLVLATLRREKVSRTQALREMEAAAQRLTRMVDQVTRRNVSKPTDVELAPSSGIGLGTQRGRLEWPVSGRVSAPFGKFMHPELAAEMFRKGIDIEAASGEIVRAVERGRVVHASHFPGYGNMMIVDHGERYYTIYGHLSEFSKKRGDELRRGEVLGRVGGSDSWSGAKLYFEMRKDGRSVDPLGWLKKP
jgi:septal ring factor EnvC (AmiA/AmiB activator)